MLQNMYEFMKPMAFDKDSLGFDAIAGVPTGGHFGRTPYHGALFHSILSADAE